MTIITFIEHAGTAADIAGVAMIVAIRTFLSWSLSLELEGHWPWQRARERAGATA